MSVLTMSKETGIPSYRIYKWIDGKGKPKAEDSAKLEEWLNDSLDIVPNGTQKVSNPYDAAYLTGKLESKEDVLAEKEARRQEAEAIAQYLKGQLAQAQAEKDKLFEALAKAQEVLIKSTEKLEINLTQTRTQIDLGVHELTERVSIVSDQLARQEQALGIVTRPANQKQPVPFVKKDKEAGETQRDGGKKGNRP
jgi:uncharacterized protein YPO0396